MQCYEGMPCCNRYRDAAGLSCDLGQQVACATHELIRLARDAEAGVPRFHRVLLQTFPDNADWLVKAAQHAGTLDVFIHDAALHCAALATKTARHDFRSRIAGYLNAEQIERFTGLMSAEWARLRNVGNINNGSPK